MSHNEGSCSYCYKNVKIFQLQVYMFDPNSIFWVTWGTLLCRFPNDKAAQVAVQTVQEYLEETPDSSVKNVIFNVFKNEDLQIYERILRS